MATRASTDSEPLLTHDKNDDETYPSSSPLWAHGDTRTKPTLRNVVSTPRVFFVFSCAFALALSAINLSFLSARDAYHAYAATRAPKRRPSVYTGLSNVKSDAPRCRSKIVYPTEYFRFSGRDVKGRTQVHRHRDEVTFEFGSKESAYLHFYIGDYGLENCTLTFRSVLPPKNTILVRDDHHHSQGGGNKTVGPDGEQEPHGGVRAWYMNSTTTLYLPPAARLNLYLLTDSDSLKGRKVIDSLSLDQLGDDGNVTTRPFWCPNSRYINLQAECKGDCRIQFGLQGMTTWTSGYNSVNKTGFWVNQYEGLTCIP